MNAVTEVGAPWYTSGVHMWNGTAATLKPNPTITSIKAMRIIESSRPRASTAAAISTRRVLPAAPKMSEMP